MKNIRVLFLGDEKVGKTSLISTLLSETFPRNVQKTIQPVVIPPDFSIQTINTSTYIIDTSSSPEDQAAVDIEIEKANVILLVYDVTNGDTVTKLRTHWFPRIHYINKKVPVILAGNKLDLRLNISNSRDLENIVTPLCIEFNQLEMGLECSAKSYVNIIDLIYCAQRAVLFPISPLFDSQTKTLKEDFVKALKRIFRICDKDHDCHLNDSELSEFQMEVFQGELNRTNIEALKEVILSENIKASEEEIQGGINFEGFMCLHRLMIQKMKLQSCWSILRHFGYDDNLRISEEYFIDKRVKKGDIPEAESAELSSEGETFLKDIFDLYKNNNNTLEYGDFLEIFSTTNRGAPWNVKRVTETLHGKGDISLQHWIALWQMSFRLDYKRAFETMVYIGFEQHLKDSLVIRSTKREDSIRHNNRKVYHCYIVGSPKCGKSSFLDAFIKYPPQESPAATTSERSVVNCVPDKHSLKYLILTEFPEIEVEALLNNEKKMKSCDVMCLLYEKGDRESLQYLLDNSQYLPRYIPKMLIQTHSDKNDLEELQLQEAAHKLGVIQYCNVTIKDTELLRKCYQQVLSICIEPSKGLSNETINYFKKLQSSSLFDSKNLFQRTLVVASIVFVSILIGVKYKDAISNLFRRPSYFNYH